MRARGKSSWATRLLGVLTLACFGGAACLWGCSLVRSNADAALAPVAALEESDATFVIEDALAKSGDSESEPRAAAVDPSDANAASVAAASARAQRSWADAEERYPGLAAWVVVEGTTLSSPVMQANDVTPNFYLNHNAWGERDATGVPYLDARSSATEPVRIAYGHNLGWGSYERLSPLADAWQQEAFDELGSATWAVPDAKSRIFVPLCALKVASSDSDLLSFDLTADEVAAWVTRLAGLATATAPGASALARGAREALVLITCTNGVHPANDRSVVVFVR